MRIQHLIGAVLSAATLAACSGHDASPSTAPDPGDSAFAVSFSGDQIGSMHGFTFTQQETNGYTEMDGSGHSQSTNVVSILLATIDVSPAQVIIGPQVNIGLMGALVPGTYHVHASGTALGTKPEFFGSYSITNSDSSRTQYQATTGTVTITSVSPKIQGTFSFHSARSLSWPAHLVLNQVLPSAPASLDASGSFVAKLP